MTDIYRADKQETFNCQWTIIYLFVHHETEFCLTYETIWQYSEQIWILIPEFPWKKLCNLLFLYDYCQK